MDTSYLTALMKDVASFMPFQMAPQPTLPAKHVSVILHEPAILNGYRMPYKPWKYYFYSLFHCHNETVNVWTHLIGILLIIHQLYGYFQEFDVGRDRVLSILLPFGISCIVCLFVSSTVHLLHAKSPYVHFVGFMIDFIGAATNSFGYGITFFYGLSDFNTYHSFEYVYLPLVAIVSFSNFVIMCLAKLWYGHDPCNMKRKYMMIGGMAVQAALNFSPAISRYYSCYHDDACSMSSLNHISVLPPVFILQAIAFAAHQPERTWPGKFDIIGHGHQLFHVLVIVNYFFQFGAIYRDYKLGITSHCDPNLTTLLSVMAGLLTLQALVLVYLVRFVPEALKRATANDALANNALKPYRKASNNNEFKQGRKTSDNNVLKQDRKAPRVQRRQLR